MPDDRFQPDAAVRRVVDCSPRMSVADRQKLGEFIGKELGEEPAIVRPPNDPRDALFEDRGPIGHVGRNSIPRSHRGEGFNYVD